RKPRSCTPRLRSRYASSRRRCTISQGISISSRFSTGETSSMVTCIGKHTYHRGRACQAESGTPTATPAATPTATQSDAQSAPAHRAPDLPNLVEILEDVAGIGHLASARAARRAIDHNRADRAAGRACLGRDLESDGAGRALRNQLHRIEQRTAKQVGTLESIAETDRGP